MDTTYFKVAKISDIPPGEGKGFEVNGLPVAIFNLQGKYYAVSNLCTHVAAPLCDGTIDGEIVICPWHGAMFHIPTGQIRQMPANRDLDVYSLRIVGDDIEVAVTR